MHKQKLLLSVGLLMLAATCCGRIALPLELFQKGSAYLLGGDNVQLMTLLSSRKVFRQPRIDSIGVQPAVQILCNPSIPYTAKKVYQLQSARMHG